MLDMTDKLDSEWRELLPVMKNLTKNDENDRQPDEYDRLVKEMIFSPRAEPTEKLKNEEEVARLEKEKLMKLEKERLARMEKEEEENTGEKKIKHKSADDLDDGYFLEAEEIIDDKVLAYDINPEDQEDDNEDNESEQEDDGEEQNDENNEESADEECEDEEEDEESDNDSLNDLKPDSEDEDEAEVTQDEDDESENEEKVQETSLKVLKISDEPKVETEKVEKPEKSEIKHAELLKTIPFTIGMPLCYEHLEELLGDHPISVQVTIVDRIIKTNHPKLMHANKSKMLQLFAFLIQLLNDKFSSENQENLKKSFKLLKSLTPHLYDIVHMSPAETSNCFLEVIKEKYEEFKKNPKNFPKLDTMFLFMILGKIFPTSDFKHSVVTPTYIFIQHIFSQARVKSRSEIARGLFLATLVLEYQELSKRFMPSVLNFLSGICYLGCDRTSTLNEKPIPPFKRSEPILLVKEKVSEFDIETKLGCDDFKNSEINDEFRLNALNVNVQLIRDFIHLYQDHVGIHYLIDGQLKFIKFLKEQSNLPKSLISLIKSISKGFKAIKSSKQFIYPKPDKKPTPILRQLEPQFETVLSDRRSMYAEARGGGRQEEKKLQHMVKREFKAAKRELRRDNEFINKMRFKRRQDQDRERQAKVRKIFDQASIQQSEFNKMSKSKARRSKF
jgi:nucleolar protein 14